MGWDAGSGVRGRWDVEDGSVVGDGKLVMGMVGDGMLVMGEVGYGMLVVGLVGCGMLVIGIVMGCWW